MKDKKPELLAPAGNLDILKIAFLYGADAVYCGSPDFAMRSRVGFNIDSLREGISYAHSLGKKVYLTLNAFPHSLDVTRLKKHIKELVKLNPDALIIADPGIIEYVKNNFNIPIHLSTQANTTNQLAAGFWKKQGVDRIVLARELSLKEIKKIHDNSNIELEAFVHGAMCMAYSGRCQISNYMTARDPNQGQCIQACRFKYKMYALEEDLRKKEFFPIFEDEEGTHVLNSKDLCMIEHIDGLAKTGITSLKIEGRLKTEYYVATVVSNYRKAIDLYFENPERYKKEKNKLFKELQKSANRGFTTGFYFNKPSADINNYKSSKAVSTWGYIGRALEYHDGFLKFEAKNYLPINSNLEIIAPGGHIIKHKMAKLYKNGESIEVTHANNIVEIEIGKEIPKDSLIRIKL